MRQKTFVALAGFLALLIFSPLTAYGTGLDEYAYYVNISSGSDSTGNGSETSPWQTLHHAIDMIRDGSAGIYTLSVAPGTYDISNETDGSLTLSQDNVTIIGESGSMPVLYGNNAYTWIIGIEIAGSNVTIKNLAVKGFADWGIKVSSGTEILIEGCEIHDNGYLAEAGGGGIWIENCSPDIRKNKIYNNYAYGILIEGDGDVLEPTSPHIERNEIHANNIGIAVNGYGTGNATPMITNNLIYDIGFTTAYHIECGIGVSAESGGTASPSIYHNTIDNGASDGILIYNLSSITNPDIKYNIITNFEGYGINNTGESTTIDYNDV
jgi:hypothetical protein